MKYYLAKAYHFFINRILLYIPFNYLRINGLRLFGASIGTGSKIGIGVKIISPKNLVVGKNVIINSSSFLDCRGGLIIGDNVDIAWRVSIITAYHDYDDPLYRVKLEGVEIQSYSCLAYMSTILPGVIISWGTVVASCALVNKSTKFELTIIGGCPAKILRRRNFLKNDSYNLKRRSYGW
jgi:putative colanic acid biosynthesis acetyltransferase WcaF